MKGKRDTYVGHGHRAKKALGQNFLKSQKALTDILIAGEVNEKDLILEIGPGKGALTEKLLEKAGRVIAIEKDGELIELLKEKFHKEIENKKLILIEEDILKFSNYSLLTTNYKLIANIPYYITGAIIRKFLESEHQPEKMVLLVQKEVAKRIVALDKKESILSISVKAYGKPVYIDTVKKRYFSPEPKVDSAILLIENIRPFSPELNDGGQVSKKDFEKTFFKIVKAGFAHKRKVLSSNLNAYVGHGQIKECGVGEKARAEDLGLKDWICLAKKAIL